MDPADSSNYFTVALADDQAVSSHRASPAPELEPEPLPGVQQTDRATGTAREQRIAAAVERSRSEYKAEHAYTERRWINDDPDAVRGNERPKLDKQRLEYLVTSLYYASPPEYSQALQLVLEASDQAKPLGGLTRELVDTGIRAALASGSADEAVKLASTTKSLWRAPYAGPAIAAADAYLAANRPWDALKPLLLAGPGGHVPVIQRLDHVAGAVAGDQPSVVAFRALIKTYLDRREGASTRPLFDEANDHEASAAERAPVQSLDLDLDLEALSKVLRVQSEGHAALEATVKKLSRNKGGEDVVEKSVRDL